MIATQSITYYRIKTIQAVHTSAWWRFLLFVRITYWFTDCCGNVIAVGGIFDCHWTSWQVGQLRIHWLHSIWKWNSKTAKCCRVAICTFYNTLLIGFAMAYYSSQLIRLVDLVYILPSVYYIIKKIRDFLHYCIITFQSGFSSLE